MTGPVEPKSCIGVVAIGRNEGQRLRRCLESVRELVSMTVYVDSGSTDDSVATARSLGVDVVQLDMSTPFTAARSRNAGARRLIEVRPEIAFVQFVDGDCEVNKDWFTAALAAMQSDEHSNVAVVCGRRRERRPEDSIYNRLIDMEWNTPIGEAQACGGDALVRLSAFHHVGGYDETIIAGEEPEMCWRLRHASPPWRILRLDREMTVHDAQLTRFSQWWKRSVRSGHAYAQGHALHGHVDGYCAHAVRSIVQWAIVLPLVAFGLAWLTWGASLLLLGLYAILWSRIRSSRIRVFGDAPADASLYANYCIAGKFAEAQGVLRYWCNRFLGRRSTLIEYKGPVGLSTGGGET